MVKGRTGCGPTSICLWASECLGCLLHFLLHTHVVAHLYTQRFAESLGAGGCVAYHRYPLIRRGSPRWATSGVAGWASLSTLDAEGLSAKEMCPLLPRTHQRRCHAAAWGAVEMHSPPGPATQPAAGPAVCTPPHSYPFRVFLPVSHGET